MKKIESLFVFFVIVAAFSCKDTGMVIIHNPEEDFRNPALSCIRAFEHKDKVVAVSFLKPSDEIHEGNSTYCEHKTAENAIFNVQKFAFGDGDRYEINIVCEDMSKIEAYDFTSLFKDFTSLKEVSFGKLPLDRVTSMKAMYSGCSSLESVPEFPNLEETYKDDKYDENDDDERFKNYCPTIEVLTMEEMFNGCTSLYSVTTSELSKWNTQKVKSFKNMFAGCTGLTGVSIESFEANRLENTEGMFDGCSKLEHIWAKDMTDWSKIAGILYSDNMFRGCENLPNFDGSIIDKQKAKVEGGCFSVSTT